MEVADRIHRLGDRYVNWYVIEDGDKLTVLDAGFPAHWDQLPTLLQGIGRTMRDVDAVLLTHHHPDHLGSAERIRTDANARVLIHEADAAEARRGGGNPSVAGMLKALVRPFFARYVVHIVAQVGRAFRRSQSWRRSRMVSGSTSRARRASSTRPVTPAASACCSSRSAMSCSRETRS